MRISDWSSDVCSSDLSAEFLVVSYRAIKHDNPDDHDEENPEPGGFNDETVTVSFTVQDADGDQDSAEITVSFEDDGPDAVDDPSERSEEHTSELQSLMRISYAVFCLKKKNTNIHTHCTTIELYKTHINKNTNNN